MSPGVVAAEMQTAKPIGSDPLLRKAVTKQFVNINQALMALAASLGPNAVALPTPPDFDAPSN